MVAWPNQPSLPPGAPLGWVIPPGTDPPPSSLTVWTQQQIEALRIKLQESLMQLVALAVQGFLNTGQKAFDQVASWAAQIDTAANGAADDLAELLDGILGTGHTISELVDHFQALGLDVSQNVQNWVDLLQGAGQGTATEVGEMLTTAAGQAEDVFNELAALLTATGEASFAALWTKITSLLGFLIAIPAELLDGTPPSLQELLDGLAVALGFPPGATSGDIQTYLTNAAAGWDGVVAAVADFVNDVAGATGLDDVAAKINSAVSDAADAVSDLATLIAGVSGSTITDLVNAINSGVTALARIASLISGVTGAANIGDVVTAINGATSKLASLISGVSGTTITDVVTAINSGVTALARIASLISGVSGSTITDVVNAINGATSKLAALISGVSGAASITDVVTAINGATSKLAALISGLGGTVIGDVVTFIQGIVTALTALKNALSGIFNPLQVGDVSLPNLVSQISSGLQGLLPAVVDNLDGTLTALTGLIDNLDGTFSYTPGSNPLHTLVDQADGTFATVAGAFQQAAQAATSQVGSNLTAAAANVQGVINSLFGAFGLGGGAAAPAATPAQATQAVVSAQQQLLDNAAGLAALQAVLNQAQNGGGLSVAINFPDYADGSLPGIFTAVANLPSSLGIASASPTITGGYLVDPGGGSGTGYSAMYNVATTNDDQQIISGVFTGVSSGNRPVLIGRANSGGTTYVAALYQEYSGIWILLAVVGGSPTVLGYATDTFSNGAVYSLQCGTGAVGNRVFKMLKNGNPLTFSVGGTSLSEVGTTSQFGASYRGGGVAVQGTAKCSTWTMVDNTPPAAVGSGFRVYRTSTSGATFPTATTVGVWNARQCPTSYFDTTETMTSDFSYTSSTNTLTVSLAGWYQVTVTISITTGSVMYAGVGLYKNGTWTKLMGPTLNYGSGVGVLIGGSFTVYCAAGDTLTPALYYSGTITAPYVSDSTQGNSWGVSLINRGTLS